MSHRYSCIGYRVFAAVKRQKERESKKRIIFDSLKLYIKENFKNLSLP